MEIKKGLDSRLYIAFRDQYDADCWSWLFLRVLRMRLHCFGAYMNAYGYSQ